MHTYERIIDFTEISKLIELRRICIVSDVHEFFELLKPKMRHFLFRPSKKGQKIEKTTTALFNDGCTLRGFHSCLAYHFTDNFFKVVYEEGIKGIAHNCIYSDEILFFY